MKSRKSVAKSESLRSPEAKVNADALHLELAFDRGVNLKDRIIQITGDIDYPAFDVFDAAMTELERDSRKSITIRIHSFGGSVYEALAIVGRMDRSSCHIVTESYGATMSAATLILAAGKKRRMSRRGWFMHHESFYSVEGRHAQNKAIIAQMDREEFQWAQTMAEFTGTNAEFWLKRGMHIDAYFSAEDLLNLGAIDEIF
jgi:ATP-dependent Clp protease protease subunit